MLRPIGYIAVNRTSNKISKAYQHIVSSNILGTRIMNNKNSHQAWKEDLSGSWELRFLDWVNSSTNSFVP